MIGRDCVRHITTFQLLDYPKSRKQPRYHVERTILERTWFASKIQLSSAAFVHQDMCVKHMILTEICLKWVPVVPTYDPIGQAVHEEAPVRQGWGAVAFSILLDQVYPFFDTIQYSSKRF